MTLPTFIGIGAPRCGTRWLAQCLSEHPQVSLPPEEVYFFTTRRVVHSNWERGVSWYSSLFEKCIRTGVTAWGEITPVYLFDDDTPNLMHDCIPKAKLICCLRDQSERAYSWYRLFLRFNPDIYWTKFSFRQFLIYNTDVYGREGFYLEHLRKYLKAYPRESILVLLFEDLQKDPKAYLQQVLRFLEVDPSFEPPSLMNQINRMNFTLPKSNSFEKVSGNFKKYGTLKRIGGFLHRINTIEIESTHLPRRHQMDGEIKGKMHQLYFKHNQELGKFLGRDLSHWNII